MLRKHVFISGRVQGVYFRAHTMQEADSLNIKGWVRNLPDGRVETVLEGDDESVKSMLEWLKTGIPPARVDDIMVIDENYTGEFLDFRIK
ncbi:MAG: acylphosphatase [Bacillota bacterium]